MEVEGRRSSQIELEEEAGLIRVELTQLGDQSWNRCTVDNDLRDQLRKNFLGGAEQHGDSKRVDP